MRMVEIAATSEIGHGASERLTAFGAVSVATVENAKWSIQLPPSLYPQLRLVS